MTSHSDPLPAEAKVEWVIRPILSGAVNAWSMLLRQPYNGGFSETHYGNFKTLKAAKRAIAHMEHPAIRVKSTRKPR